MEKTVQNIPFLRLTVALVSGIIIGNNFPISVNLSFAIFSVALLILLILNLNYKFSYTQFFGFGIQLTLILSGIIIVQINNKKPQFADSGKFMAIVLESPQEKPNSYKTLLKIKAVLQHDTILPSNEQIMAYFTKSSMAGELKAGDIICFVNSPQNITNSGNPYEFDYKKYLERKRIYRQVYLSENNWGKTGKTSRSIKVLAEKTRDYLVNLYRKQPFNETEFEILTALTLGYKRELEPETKRVFAASGASHVLAVSGLHVGIIFWVINLLFGFLGKTKHGRILFLTITITILWMYAFLTGLSPSVTRSALMFGLFAIGNTLQRKPGIYNTMAASAFLLLVFNPNNLYEIGFQLSYAAVFGIVYLQPKLDKMIHFKLKSSRFIWSLFTVSVAAQATTFPLTVYYFGQFPAFFWLTNIFIIPVVSILIPGGILLLAVSQIPYVPGLISIILSTILKSTYFVLSFIEQLPFAVIGISLSTIQFILILLILSLLLLYINIHSVNTLKAVLVATLVFLVASVTINIKKLNTTELIVFNNYKNPVIQLIQGKRNYIISEESISDEDLAFHPSMVVKRKMGLNAPVFLMACDTFRDDKILIKNRMIFFEGKSIAFGLSPHIFKMGKTPDFIVNPSVLKLNTTDIKSNTTIITNKRFLSKDYADLVQIHSVALKGAFKKKW